MQLEDATVLESSSGKALPAVHDGANGGGDVIMEEKGREGGGGSGGEEGDDKINNINGGGGNRWPRQETLALLKIRSDMDGVFRDSSLKGPLWEEVSRKLGALGYQRSAKKCKEKFENVYKYHKRTKESRSGKSEGKTYRFFDQLQALENQFTLSSYPPPKPQPPPPNLAIPFPTTTRPSHHDNNTTTTATLISHVTTTNTTVPSTNPTTLISPPPPTPTPTNANNNVPYSLPNMNLFSTTTTSTSTSSSTASDEDLEEKYRKKRKWKDYFRRLTRQVLAKQEEMQKRFLEAIDKREREHMAQQDAWRMQEMARINREHELLIQERSTAAAKNAAVIAFLQKLSGQQNPTTQQPPQPPQQQQPPPPEPSPQPTAVSVVQTITQQQLIMPHSNNNGEIFQNVNTNGHHLHSGGSGGVSSSRWPQAEVHALIRLRTSLEPKYQENGPKAPLWEDISAGMQRLGYNRSSKRCKEKWENINKYFKKMKESNKQRREDSKTCPYFHELEALYKEKGKTLTQNPFGGGALFQSNMKANEMMEPLMVQPEQQWRPPPQYEEGVEKKKNNEDAREEEEEEEEEEDGDDNDEEGEEGDSNGMEVMRVGTNEVCSVDTVE